MSKERLSVKVAAGGVPDLLARRAYETMNDGRWHDMEDVISDLGRLIPPGVAVRRADRDLEANRRTRARRGLSAPEAGTPRVRPVTRDQQIATGRRGIVREFLNTGVGFDRSSDGQKIRMLKMPHAVKSDRARGETIQPLLDGLLTELTSLDGDPLTADQTRGILRRTAHEWGIHLATCPKGCELLPASAPVIIEDSEG